jgi:DNA mismatch endonuclease, patch repair protein
MADTVTPAVRSRMMAGIRSKDTKPEMIIRRGLHARGFRFRLHDRSLPGCPDMVFPKWKAVIFVHGCFWHGHDCHLFRWPKTREDFWREKIGRNRSNDSRTGQLLDQMGWRQCIIWECALKRNANIPVSLLLDACSIWLTGSDKTSEIRGKA